MGQKLVSPATYWRRRVVVLAACLSVLTLLTWGVNLAISAVEASGTRSPRPPVAGPGVHSQAAHSPAAHGRSTAGHAHPQAGSGDPPAFARETADLGHQRGPSPQPSASHPDASAAQSNVGTASLPGAGAQACTSRDVALTLSSSQRQYGPSTLVTFTVSAVSSGSRPCSVNLGSKFVSVVVASSGTPLWDSSSCLRGTGSQVVTLRRGVPAFLRVTWDQRTTLSGCPGHGSTVRAGTYTAAAFYDQVRSHAISFVLSGQSAASP